MDEREERSRRWSRRAWLGAAATGSAGASLAFRAFAESAGADDTVTAEAIDRCEWLTGIDFTPEEKELMLGGVTRSRGAFAEMRQISLDNSIPPAFHFAPRDRSRANGASVNAAPSGMAAASAAEHGSPVRPALDEDVAFMPVHRLARLIESRQLGVLELTEIYLARLERLAPSLECVITLTPELAREQALRADREIAAGEYRGPLHGIPWGAKDLLSLAGYPTTWGATPFKEQVRDETATVISKLERAGSIHLAKLTLGALAWGDVWFDGMTRNPWNLEQGSSGSSAGSASAVAAGLVGFAIGSETWGSIVSPCTRCGASGLRPTFGRVSRHGAMMLSWTMDKLGPIARSVEDLALTFSAIEGADERDPSSVDAPFEWPHAGDVRRIRVGYLAPQFDHDRGADIEDAAAKADLAEWQSFDLATLDLLRSLRFELAPVELREPFPVAPLSLILTSEASATFDQLTRSGRDEQLVRQVENAWPNEFRLGQLVPAVEYLRAQRLRTLLIRETEQLFETIDVIVAPAFVGNSLLHTNLTGHPQVVVPNGFRSSDGTPTSVTFIGRLFGESALLAVAAAYQEATEFHRRRPTL